MSHDAWEFTGTLQHPIYSPRGSFEGFLLDVDGVPVQFVADESWADRIGRLKAGQPLRAVGTARPPSDKGPGDHEVYELDHLPGLEDVDEPRKYAGKVVRLNYAKHGEANGVVLDTGDFLHTKPHGLRQLGWKVGQHVSAEGPARPLVDGAGKVVEVSLE